MMTGIEAGRAYVKFLIEDSELKKSLKGIGTKLKNVGKIGAAATAPLVAAFSGATAVFVKAGDELDKMSLRTGITVQTLSELSYVAGQSGTSMDAVEKALKKVATTVYEASRGTKTHVEALAAVGLAYEDLAGLSPDDQFHKIAMAVASVTDPTMRAAVAQRIFGKAGTELLPMLAQGADGIQALRDRARELGLTMDNETAAAAAALGDNLDDLKQQTKAMGIQLGAAIAGPLTEFAKSLQPILARTIEWIKENPRLVVTVAKVTAAVATLSAAAYALGAALTLITLHPIVAFLALLASAVLVIVELYREWLDMQEDITRMLDDVDYPDYPTNANRRPANPEQAQIQAIADQAAALAADVGANPTLDAAAAMSLDPAFGEALQATADNTGELVKIQDRMLQWLLGGRGGLVVGAG